MKRLDAVGIVLRCTAASAVVLFCAAASPAEVVGGPGSLAGIWVLDGAPSGTVRDVALEVQEPKTADDQPVPMQPWAAKIVEERLQSARAGHPYASTHTRCLPHGVPDFGFGPMEILETPGQVTILREEFWFFRIIHMGGTHPADPDPAYLGHSVAHWEGGTLVVDTIGLTDKTTLLNIIPHTNDLHVVERYHPTNKDHMEIEATIDDPKTFTKPWKLVTHIHRIRGELVEYFCDNNRNVPDANGNLITVMPGRTQ